MKQTVTQCYSDCVIEEDNGYKIQRQSDIQFRDRYCKESSEDTERKEGKKLRKYVEKMNLDIEEQKDAKRDITTNCGHR